MEAPPTHERYLRQREYMDRCYRSPPRDTWNHVPFYTNRSPHHGRSGSPAYTRISREHSTAWHTPESRKRVGSPSYGEISDSSIYCVGCVLHTENPFVAHKFFGAKCTGQ